MNILAERLRKIQLDWGMSAEQLASLCHVPVPLLQSWLAPAVSEATPTNSGGIAPEVSASIPPGMENAVPLIAIHQRLQAKLPNLDDQLKWLGKSNPAFDGHKPIEIAASSLENLYWVSYTLDSLHLEKESAPARATPGNPP